MNEKIAVIGGGQMGSQIAALAAMAGYKTNIYDENKENLEYRYKFVEENIKNLIEKKIYSEIKNYLKRYSLKDVVKLVSEKNKLPRKKIYNLCLKLKK